MDRIKDSGSFGRGSNPLGGTGQRHSTSERLFFLLSVLGLYLVMDQRVIGASDYRCIWLSGYRVHQFNALVNKMAGSAYELTTTGAETRNLLT